jgi:aryl-alcohol dehydrogenase-like predicted oxidoreductase
MIPLVVGATDGDLVLGPQVGELLAGRRELSDQLEHVGVAAAAGGGRSQVGDVGPRVGGPVLVGTPGSGLRVGEPAPQRVAIEAPVPSVVAVEGDRDGVLDECLAEVGDDHRRAVGEVVENVQQDGADVGVASVRRRRGPTGEVVEVIAFVVGEPQRPRQRGQHLGRWLRAARLLEARHVVGRQRGELGHLLAAEARRASALARGQPLATPAQEVGELVTVHTVSVPAPSVTHPGTAAPWMTEACRTPTVMRMVGATTIDRSSPMIPSTNERHDLPRRCLGASGPAVSMIGLGAMGMSGAYGARDDDESVATILAALDAGVTLVDTGDHYGAGHNEMLIGRALRQVERATVQLSVKFGARSGPGMSWEGVDTRPSSMRTFLAYSLQRLGTDYIDVYRPARLDPDVPIEETIGAIGEMVDAGYVRAIGLSEVGPDTIRRAAAVHPIAALQIEYSLMSRGIEAAILPTVRELGIGIIAYGVLSRGLLSDALRTGPLAADDMRARSPRFQGDNLEHNRALVARLAAIAADKAVTVAQLAIAWVLTRGDDIVPLIGTTNADRLTEAINATHIDLTNTDLSAIDATIPRDAVAGERYAATQMANLDSER